MILNKPRLLFAGAPASIDASIDRFDSWTTDHPETAMGCGPSAPQERAPAKKARAAGRYVYGGAVDAAVGTRGDRFA